MHSYLWGAPGTQRPGLAVESWIVLGREYIHAGSELANHLNYSLRCVWFRRPSFQIFGWVNEFTHPRFFSLPLVCLAVNRVDFLPLGVEEGATVLMGTDSQGLTLGITGSISCHRGVVFLLCSPQGLCECCVGERVSPQELAPGPELHPSLSSLLLLPQVYLVEADQGNRKLLPLQHHQGPGHCLSWLGTRFTLFFWQTLLADALLGWLWEDSLLFMWGSNPLNQYLLPPPLLTDRDC